MFLDATYRESSKWWPDRVEGGDSGNRCEHRAATGKSLGVEVGDSEDGAFWIAFLRSLRARGLTGVQLVISDTHLGLREAISAVMLGATWQRCKVHLARNVLAKVPKGSADMVAAAMRTIYAQPDAGHVREQFDEIVSLLTRQFPDAATILADATTCWPSPRSRSALAQNLVHQPARTRQRRDQAPHRSRRIFPNEATSSNLGAALVTTRCAGPPTMALLGAPASSYVSKGLCRGAVVRAARPRCAAACLRDPFPVVVSIGVKAQLLTTDRAGPSLAKDRRDRPPSRVLGPNGEVEALVHHGQEGDHGNEVSVRVDVEDVVLSPIGVWRTLGASQVVGLVTLP